MIPSSPDDLAFLPEESQPPLVPSLPWKLLVVDDEPEVHLITRMVLGEYRFDGRGLSILEARSGEEAKGLLMAHPDIAVILLDVVMETDHSGLDLVKWIREVLDNHMVRIILRTGQPGAAPEKQVILEYEINDYKSKTELTSIKLFTAVTAAIRAWRDLKTIKRSKEGFQKIVQASRELFGTRAIGQFIEGVLTQLTSLLYFDEESLYLQSEGLALQGSAEDYRVIAGTGSFQGLAGTSADQLPSDLRELLAEAVAVRQSRFSGNYYVGFLDQPEGAVQHLLVLRTSEPIKETDQEIIHLFTTNVSVALENVSLNQRIESTQKEIIFTLGEVLESRSKETGNHVRRVAAFSYLLAKEAGVPEAEAQMIRLASPMHDVGKIGVSDDVLRKPGPLSPEELTEMRKHTLVGYEILRYGGSGILQTAAIIALTHHERWDGLGYPHGLQGEAIPLAGRITAIADVFDALCHRRVYKEAWSLADTWGYLKQHAGELFDPRLVEAFLRVQAQAEEILTRYDD